MTIETSVHPAAASVAHLTPDITVDDEVAATLRRVTVMWHRDAHDGPITDCERCTDALDILDKRDAGIGRRPRSKNPVRNPIRE